MKNIGKFPKMSGYSFSDKFSEIFREVLKYSLRYRERLKQHPNSLAVTVLDKKAKLKRLNRIDENFYNRTTKNFTRTMIHLFA